MNGWRDLLLTVILICFVGMGKMYGNRHDEANNKLREIAYNISRQQIPEFVFDSTDIPLGGHWYLKLSIKKKGEVGLMRYTTAAGDLSCALECIGLFELVGSKVTWRIRTEHPETGLFAKLLKKYRSDEKYIINWKHHEDLNAIFGVRLDILANVLGSEYIHSQTEIFENWRGSLRPKANFWEINLRSIAGKEMQQHFKNYANALADSIRENMHLLNRRYTTYEIEGGKKIDDFSKTYPDFPIRFESIKNIKSIQSKNQFPDLDLRGKWQAKGYVNGFHGQFGTYRAKAIVELLPNGEMGKFEVKVLEIIKAAKIKLLSNGNVPEQFIYDWFEAYGIKKVHWKLHPSRERKYDYYLTIYMEGIEKSHVFPIVIQAKRKIYLISMSRFGDLLTIPFSKVSR